MARVTVGSVAIKVSPDTTGFAREANDKLDRIEPKLHRLKVKLVPDTKGLLSECNRAIRVAQAALKNLEVNMDLDRDGLARKAREAVREAQATCGEIDVDMQIHKDKLTALKDQKVKVELEPDKKRLEQALKEIGHGDAKVAIKPEVDDSARAKTLAELKAIARDRRSSIKIHVDGLEGLSTADLMLKNIAFPRMGKVRIRTEGIKELIRADLAVAKLATRKAVAKVGQVGAEKTIGMLDLLGKKWWRF